MPLTSTILRRRRCGSVQDTKTGYMFVRVLTQARTDINKLLRISPKKGIESEKDACGGGCVSNPKKIAERICESNTMPRRRKEKNKMRGKRQALKAILYKTNRIKTQGNRSSSISTPSTSPKSPAPRPYRRCPSQPQYPSRALAPLHSPRSSPSRPSSLRPQSSQDLSSSSPSFDSPYSASSPSAPSLFGPNLRSG